MRRTTVGRTLRRGVAWVRAAVARVRSRGTGITHQHDTERFAIGTALGSRVLRASAVAATLTCASRGVQAQVGSTGALFLLQPSGGRGTGMGDAVVADTLGIESHWWNPAGLARQSKTEVMAQGWRNFFFTTTAVGIAKPSKRIGTVAASLTFMDLGTQPSVDDAGNEQGQLFFRNWIAAASYATTVARRVDVGLTYRFFQTRIDCSGACVVPVSSSSSSAVDVGVRYTTSTTLPIALGASVINIGPSFQVNDQEQSDPLPTAFDAGATVGVPAVTRRAKDLRLRIGTSVRVPVASEGLGVSLRTGGELLWQDRASLRLGYTYQRGAGGAPTVGFGVKVERLILDFSVRQDAVARATSQPTTFVSLRFVR
ncbi:MAG: PorV/PorQ family protein [Gemmatimonadaceae bacterium]|nr:PorV/PorQ family protein [Gemmatimonadaceae bacterium]